MNIFYTSKCPVESANFLDDKRVGKMIMETAQLLSNGLMDAGLSIQVEGMSAPIRQGKELSNWCVASKANYKWMLDHMDALNKEYVARYNKDDDHGSYKKRYAVLASLIDLVPEGSFFEPPNWTENKTKGISFKHIKQVDKANRMYLNARYATDTNAATYYGEVL